MILSHTNAKLIGRALDHPEAVCVGPDGVLYAGGEAGQLYALTRDGSQRVVATTGGFLLGLALDGDGGVHACDYGRKAVVVISPNGTVRTRSCGTAGRAMQTPNSPVFDLLGRLFVSDSGDYWSLHGTGCIFVINLDDTTDLFHSGPFRFANGLAIDPSGQWLYIVQSTASNVVRVPLDRPEGPIELVYELPPDTVPDGLAFTSDGQLLIACYKPDAIYLGEPDGEVRRLWHDPTGELLNRPTNIALHNGCAYVANLGGWHITKIAFDAEPAVVNRPSFAVLAPCKQ